MTRATTTDQIKMLKCGGISPHSYRVPYSQTRFVRMCGIWVPGDDATVVQSIQRDEASNGDNLLHRPVQLVYLNNVLQWFDWLLQDRSVGFVLGFDRACEPIIEVEQEIPVDWVAHHADQAFHSWSHKNPTALAGDWLRYLSARFENGNVTCKFNDCEAPIVPGTRECKEHQGR